MYTASVVPLQIALLLAAVVALCLWQWYEYTVAKRLQARRCENRQTLPSGEFEVSNAPNGENSMSDRTTAREAPAETANASDKRCRLRDLGVTPGKLPTGPHNAITDVGVMVGHTTLIEGEGELVPGKGPVRTGVTVILPHAGDVWNVRASAGAFVINGNGSVTSLDWLKESGLLEGPIALTNTHSVGDVYSGLIRWMISKHPQVGITDDTYLPVVGECDDSPLNDIQGFHVKPQHVIDALNRAAGGAVAEGTVGAGTGMSCYDFKGGIGTSSRVVELDGHQYTVGVLVNCNHGNRDQLKVVGVPVGKILDAEMSSEHREGSIVIVVATDAPLSARQLDRIAKRAAMGLALTGATANHASGDFVIAFSNGRLVPRDETPVRTLPELNDEFISPLFEATVEATEESVLNALCAATTVVGRDGNVSPAIPLDRLRQLLVEYRRISE